MARGELKNVIKMICAMLVIIGGLITAIAGSYALSLHAIGQSQHQWCATLTLLTAQPVAKPAHPEQNPSREQNYQFYSTLVQLRRQFGCSP